ncbi:hypothetical protein GCM10022214_26970 [Actinomadura miaoliensis]|uniref:Uncharacterized protein n=1 Tax=Actinomadura miaoliensis TaxID=430685 RepID=A0ABP7VLU8_9ACTN
MAYMIVPSPGYLPLLARSVHTVPIRGRLHGAGAAPDGTYFARMLKGIARYMPAIPWPSR